MEHLAKKFQKLKKYAGGSREKTSFEYTMETPEELMQITMPSRANTRILSELEFAIHLSEAENGAWEELIEKALDHLLECGRQQGVLTDRACEEAEELLMPIAPAAREYELILAAHAHIDMNWMWSFQETVAVTLATFRSVLNIMDQYPDFCFSQSQASVYQIVEEYDPDMMEEIRRRIAEGRWEVTATSWVETDKNMPSGESLLRHIEYTRDYLTRVWGVKRLEVDFSPDTFGHSANIPEINTYGGVKYYYHCRGNQRREVLYRYRAPSGKEILVHKEHNWYNSGITPHIGIQAPRVSSLSGGLKTGLVVYGVGDHGGGPTRRDVERALEMMEWRIFPRIRFGTLHQYFDEAQKVWEKLPVVEEELNFIFPGCYTTQSRIKRGNRRLEAALMDAEHMTALAGSQTGFRYAKKQLTKAWRKVLFTHFHDILTGSCVQDSREYAMGLYQTAMAAANTQVQKAMDSIARSIDTSSIVMEPDARSIGTSSIVMEPDACHSRSEGAGAGFGLEKFIGVPSTERGSGRTRIFHVFNTMPFARKETVELAVWDWTGDFSRLRVRDFMGNALPFQLLDDHPIHYWNHRYFRVLVEVTVPALGYTTLVLWEKEPKECPVYLQPDPQVTLPFDDLILENEWVRARIDRRSGRLVSLADCQTGMEMIADGDGAGFTYLETEPTNMSAWLAGRYLKEIPVGRCLELKQQQKGELRQSVKAVYEIKKSRIEVIYSLDRGARAVKLAVKIDWRGHGVGKDTIPALDYRVPAAYEVEGYQYDIPAGAIRRKAIHNDVPGLSYGLAMGRKKERGLLLVSDSKYGYRGADNTLALKLIHSAVNPDPYPERGIHTITLWLGICPPEEKQAGQLASACNHSLFYQPSNCHKGTLPMEGSLLKVEGEGILVSAVVPCEDGSVLVRVYEASGRRGRAAVSFRKEIHKAAAAGLSGDELPQGVQVDGNRVILPVEPYSLAAVRVWL